MSDNKNQWDVYFCKQPDPIPEEPQPDPAPAPEYGDIPISKFVRGLPPEEEEYVNDYDSDPDDTYTNAFSRFWLKRNKRNLKVFLTLLLVLLLAATVAFVLIINKKLNLIDYNSGINFEHADQTQVDEDEELSFTPVHDVTDASSLKDWLQKWAQNGEKLHSKNIVNCLLCGIDTEDGSGRTDAMILVSLNKKTNKITLVSFMRDSYTYMDINGEDRWYKINSAYNWGGAATLVETIENNYKIQIDNYVTVDFDTFPKLINALGGVTVEVQEYEAKFINRTTVHTIDYGPKVTLDGWEALVFARIRKCDADGDVSRTRRQRQLVTSLISKAKSASVGQLNNLMNTVLPYVQTNYRKSQLLSLGTQALIQGWVGYPMEQITCPLVAGTADDTGKDSYMMTGYGSVPEFVWVVDYQQDAQRVQQALYGMTNIEVHEDFRDSPFDFLSGNGNGSSAQTTTYAYNTTTKYYSDNDDYDYNYEEDPNPYEPESTTRLIDRFKPDLDNLNPFEPRQTEPPANDVPPADGGETPNSFDENNGGEDNAGSIFQQ